MLSNFNLDKRMYNSSSLKDYLGCPRLFYYTWIKKLVPKTVKPSLRFGTAWHEVMLVWYETGNMEEAMKKFASLPSSIVDDFRTREWGEAIFKQYIERYPLNREPGKTLYLEEYFRIEVRGKLYAGRIDRIEDWAGQIYVDDHKTTASLGLSFFNNFRPDIQIDGYCYACRELVGRCHGAIINGVSVAKNPKDRFQRFPSSRSDEELDNFEQTFDDWTSDIERDVERKRFAMKPTYCNRWGKCKFWELCVYGADEKYIEQNFAIKKDDK